MTYATYQYYTDEYFGTALTEQEFPKYAKRASAEMDHVTFGRLSELPDEQITDRIMDCMCDVAERLYTFATTAEGGSIASENNDGYSVSYRDIGNINVQKEEIYATIRTYLANTGLMYRGVGGSEEDDMCDS